MKKFVCTICGYVHEGDGAPDMCPICKAKAEKFQEQAGEKTWAAEHVVGVAKGVDERIIEGLPKSVSTGRRQPMKRQSMLQSLQSF